MMINITYSRRVYWCRVRAPTSSTFSWFDPWGACVNLLLARQFEPVNVKRSFVRRITLLLVFPAQRQVAFPNPISMSPTVLTLLQLETRFWGTKLLGFSIGRGLGLVLQGLMRLFISYVVLYTRYKRAGAAGYYPPAICVCP